MKPCCGRRWPICKLAIQQGRTHGSIWFRTWSVREKRLSQMNWCWCCVMRISISLTKLCTAVEFLNRAIELVRQERWKPVACSSSAQIHQQTGQFEEASRYYKMVIKRNASFEMEFKSRSILLFAMWQNRVIVLILSRSWKECSGIKEQDYRDQIYFALASVALKMPILSLPLVTWQNQSLPVTETSTRKRFHRWNLPIFSFHIKITSCHRHIMTAPWVSAEKNSELQGDQQENCNPHEPGFLPAVDRTEDSLQKLASMTESQRLRWLTGSLQNWLQQKLKNKKKSRKGRKTCCCSGNQKNSLRVDREDHHPALPRFMVFL